MIYDFEGHQINLLDCFAIVSGDTETAQHVALYFTGIYKPVFEFEFDLEDELARQRIADLKGAHAEITEEVNLEL